MNHIKAILNILHQGHSYLCSITNKKNDFACSEKQGNGKSVNFKRLSTRLRFFFTETG